MLGHLQTPDAFAEVKVVPTIPGITRLELCSAFGGNLEYVDTYTNQEDPCLWQEQTEVQELVLDGGCCDVLLVMGRFTRPGALDTASCMCAA